MRDDHFESDVRAALRLELTSARVGVAAPQVRGRIAARERTRRTTRLVLLAAAAILAVAVAIPVLGGLVLTGPLAPRPGGVEPATVASLDAASGDLVLARAWPDGRIEEAARYPGALDLVREATGQADAPGLPVGAVATAGSGGRLAVALHSGGILVFRGPGDARGSFVSRPIDGAGAMTWLGWARDGRLAVVDDRGIVRLVDPATARETTSALPEDVIPELGRADGPMLLTWADDGRIVARRSDRATFGSEIGLVDVTAQRPTFDAGQPARVRIVTGVEPLQAPDGSRPTSWSPGDGAAPGAEVAGVGTTGSGADARVQWYAARDGERVFDQAWTADRRALLVVTALATGVGGRVAIVDAPGSWREALSIVTPENGCPSIEGVAPGGRTVAVSTGCGIVAVGDIATGEVRHLPGGTLFVGWPTQGEVVTSEVPVLPTCAPPAADAAASIAISAAGTVSPASSGTPPVVGDRGDGDPWRVDALSRVDPVVVEAGGRLTLALPAGTCAEAVLAEVVPWEPAPNAVPGQVGAWPAGSGAVAGLVPIAAPESGGDWILRVKLWLSGADREAILLYRVTTPGPAKPVVTPEPATP